MSFNTVEDVNGAQFDNQGFWWHRIDTSVIDLNGDAEFEDVKLDFCTISKTKSNGSWVYLVTIDNSLFTLAFNVLDKNKSILTGGNITFPDGKIRLVVNNLDDAPVTFLLYMGVLQKSAFQYGLFYLEEDSVNLTLKELNETYLINYREWGSNTWYSLEKRLTGGYNEIEYNNSFIGYLLVNLVKTDFQFNCNQSLTLGEVNTVQLGTDTDYKLDGDLVGEYNPTITVEYANETIPVTWDESLNDYTFDLDLINKQNEGKIRFKVLVESNEVLNATETEVKLDCTFKTINTFSELQTLFRNGGIGRVGANITLNSDLTLTNDVYLIGNDNILNMQSHKIIVASDKTFSTQNAVFNEGLNTIQQEIGSTVEITECTFNNCTGLGSVIDCQVDVQSLTDEDDFHTKITSCTFNNNEMCILHGGELTVIDCIIRGKIGNKLYPYFLYQTDGNATLLENNFSLTSDEQIEYDLEFNTCIFVCGETAQINGHTYNELQANNLQNFLTVQRNTSMINVTYYYQSIEDYVTLQSDKGYCHSVSDVDYVFKTNINLQRGD